VEATPSTPLELSFAHCDTCGRDVLTHTDYAADGAERRLCVHCDGDVTSEPRSVRIADLDAEGYAVLEEEGCGRPDCGGGRCGRS
jgi:hypothetical protein